MSDWWREIWKQGLEKYTLVLFSARSAFEPSHSWKRARQCQESGRKNLKSSAASLACVVINFGSQWRLSTYFHGEKLILQNFSRLRRVATSVSYPEVRIRKETEIGLVQTWSTGFGQDFKTEIWPMFWGWYLRFDILWKYNWEQRGKVIPRTWFHSFFSRCLSKMIGWLSVTS